MKKRNNAFDILCGLCIIRMVSLHTMQFCGLHQEHWWVNLMSWTFFFMSFFFFKAGYFNKGTTGATKPYLIDRAKRLLIPYFSAGTVGFAIFMAIMPFILHRYHKTLEPLSWDHIWTTSEFYGNIPVWFLFSFCMMYVAVHFIENAMVKSPKWVKFVLPLFICALPALSYYFFTLGNPVWMSLGNLPIGIFFFYLGHWWHGAINRMGNKVTFIVSCLLVIAFVLSNIFWHGEYIMSCNEFQGGLMPTVVNTVCILCGLSGILLVADMPRIPWLCYIGEHSMVYFISHYPMLVFYKFVHLSFGRSIYGRYDDVIILLPAMFMICSWLVPYIESTPWLSGRWKKKAVQAGDLPQPSIGN